MCLLLPARQFAFFRPPQMALMSWKSLEMPDHRSRNRGARHLWVQREHVQQRTDASGAELAELAEHEDAESRPADRTRLDRARRGAQHAPAMLALSS
jgi:hypothetical protein